MKKIDLLLFALLLTITASAADLTGIKIYVNPGHGGHDPANDRNIVTIPFPAGDVNGYWESNSNLTKGLALRDMLQAAGATVVMSRTQNTDADDRALSSIVAEANTSNADAFLSIHSNAGGTTTNYVLMLYAGIDANDTQQTYPSPTPYSDESRALSTIIANTLITNQLTVWSSSSPQVRGDKTFGRVNMGWDDGYGVLRGLTVRGLISEGSFHEYKPEAHRFLNPDYCRLEAIHFYRSFCSYFQKNLPQTGVITGFVKSQTKKIDHPLFTYISGSPDQWLPLNGATVKLLDAAGTNILETYTIDNYYNGVFAFYDLTPGNYQLSFEATGYTAKTVDVAVTATAITYTKVYLATASEDNYPEPEQESDVSAKSDYRFSALYSANPEWLQNAAGIKRALYRDGKYYILTSDPKILVINAQTNEQIKALSLTGIAGGTSIVSDIAFTADGYLLACNKETIPFENSTVGFKVYTWDNDNADPALLFQTQYQANWTTGIVGETLAVSGARSYCKIYTTSQSSTTFRVVGLEYTAPSSLTYKYMMDDSAYTVAKWGEHPVFTMAPSGTGDHLYIDSETLLPAEYQFDWGANDRSPLVKKAEFAAQPEYSLGIVPRGGVFFRYAKHVYWATPVCAENAARTGLVLFDVTGGLDKAVKVSAVYPENGLGNQPATYMAAFASVSGYDIRLAVLAKNQGIASYKTVNTSPKANIFASELSYPGNGKFKFTLNEDALSLTFHLYDGAGTEIETAPAGAFIKGIHEIDNPFTTDLSTVNGSWGITAETDAVTSPRRLTSGQEAQLVFYSPRGIAVDNSFDSPFFGRIYVAESLGGTSTENPLPVDGARTTVDGVYILNALLEDVTAQGAAAYTGGEAWQHNGVGGADGSPMRLTVAPDGRVFINDLSNAHSGVWVMNPARPEENFISVFDNTARNASNGVVTGVHGSITHSCVWGMGEETKLYTFDDDDPLALGRRGNLLRYDIGTKTLPVSGLLPVVVFENNNVFYASTNTAAGLANAEVSLNSIAPDGRGGWWISNSNAAVAESAGRSALIHVNKNGTVDFQSFADINTQIGTNLRGGMAVSYEGDKIAVNTNTSAVIKVFDAVYDADGKPALTLAHSIPANFGGSAGTNNDGIAFDRAGNLYVVSTARERLGVWALPKAENRFTTLSPGSKAQTALRPLTLGDALTVYPNPVVTGFTIGGQRLHLQSYALYDVNGRMVASGKLNAEQTTVTVAGLKAGVYILQVKTADNTLVKRIIKK
jgi:hypothetical protein